MRSQRSRIPFKLCAVWLSCIASLPNWSDVKSRLMYSIMQTTDWCSVNWDRVDWPVRDRIHCSSMECVASVMHRRLFRLGRGHSQHSKDCLSSGTFFLSGEAFCSMTRIAYPEEVPVESSTVLCVIKLFLSIHYLAIARPPCS